MRYKVFPLIPRVRVNFSFSDLVRSLFVCESKHRYRGACQDLFSEYFEGRSTLLVGSGRSAIYHILRNLPQRKVLVPAYTCIVVPEAVTFAGKEIIYVPTESGTFNSNSLPEVDQDTIVIATHQFGFACDIENIQKTCAAAGAILIEDCAAAMGTAVGGKKVGTFGDFAIVSFNSTKLLTVPSKGGLIVAKNKQDIERIKSSLCLNKSDVRFKAKHLIRGLIFCLTKNVLLYRCYHYLAIDRKDKIQRTEHEGISTIMEDSYNYEFTEWQAAILLPQVKKIEKIVQMRKSIFRTLDERLYNPLLKKPERHGNEACCRYPVLVERRKEFYKRCLDLGVDMDFSHCSLACPKEFELEHRMAEKVMDIPFYYDLSNKEINKIIDVVNSIHLD